MNLKWLLALVPIGIALAWSDANPLLVFLASALAIIPLASLLGDATEALVPFMGPKLGGLLNATLGTVPEIIIGFFALKQGLVDMVKASITGSIIGTLLFGLGLAILAGGLKWPIRVIRFDPMAGRLHGGLLMLATFGLIIPAVFDFSTSSERELSVHIAIVLFLAYLLSVIFTLTSDTPDAESDAGTRENRSTKPEAQETDGSLKKALVILASATIGLAVMSEIMTDAVDPAAKSLGLTPLFAGVFLLAVVGNIADLINSVRFARKDQFDLALGIIVGGSTQSALLVAPLLVFFGLALGQGMNLLFSPFELVALVLTVLAVKSILEFGTVRWIGGALLIAIYLMLGFGFYYAPATVAGG